MRRVQTYGLPDQPDAAEKKRWYNWDFRPAPSGWILEIDMHAPRSPSARPRYPEQGAWLAAQGLPAPNAHGQLLVEGAALARLTAALAPIARVPWAAWEAKTEVDQREAAGDIAGALAATERLVALAPDWEAGRVRRLTFLIHPLRDPDAAEAELERLPPGLLSAAEQRRHRQSIALLRDDWVAYEREQAQLVAEGARQPWAWETLGLARWAVGRLEDALAAFIEGQADHPGNRDLANREAEMLAVLGRTDDALARLDQLLGEGPHAKTIALRGWVRRQRDPVAAAADYEAALGLDPEQPIARVGRGILRMESGDLAGAHADLAPFTHCGWSEAADAWQRLQALTGHEEAHHHHHVSHDHR